MPATESSTISCEVIRQNILEGKYLLPHFQRKMVWKELQMLHLLDSLGRGFPIGSMICVDMGASAAASRLGAETVLGRAKRSVVKNTRVVVEDDEGGANQLTVENMMLIFSDEEEEEMPSPQATAHITGLIHVLDGQQRLATQAKLFLKDAAFVVPNGMGAGYEEGGFYFDLEFMVECLLNPEGNGEPLPARVAKNDHPKWVVFRTEGRFSQDKAYLSVPYIFDPDGDTRTMVGDFLSSFPKGCRRASSEKRKGLPLTTEEVKRFSKKIEDVFVMIRNYHFPIVTVRVAENDITKVAMMFERINSSGTSLSEFDVAVSVYSAQNIWLNRIWEQTWKHAPKIAAFSGPVNRPNSMNLPLRLLQIAHALVYTKEADNLKFKNSTYELGPDEIKDAWVLAAKHLNHALHLAETEFGCIRYKPNSAVISTLAAFLAYAEKEGVSFDLDALKRWYWARSFRTGAGSAYQIGEMYKELRNWAHNKGSLTTGVPFSRDKMVELRSSSNNKYRTILSLIASRHPFDLRTGERLAMLPKTEDHHIFPNIGNAPARAQVANRLLVSQATNLCWKKERREPLVYITDLLAQHSRDGSLKQFTHALERLCIPYDEASLKNEEIFFAKRSHLIYEAVLETTGPERYDPQGFSEDDFEDDDDGDGLEDSE